jgi:alpha-N-arabinofuranosidase
MTENGGPAWRQTIFYPFLQASLFGRGEVLKTWGRCPVYDNKIFGGVPYLESIATWKAEAGELTVPKAVNTRDNPSRVTPRRIGTTRIDQGSLQAVLPRLSWNVIRIRSTIA